MKKQKTHHFPKCFHVEMQLRNAGLSTIRIMGARFMHEFILGGPERISNNVQIKLEEVLIMRALKGHA